VAKCSATQLVPCAQVPYHTPAPGLAVGAQVLSGATVNHLPKPDLHQSESDAPCIAIRSRREQTAKRRERRRRAYAYAGAIAEVGLASIQGELDLTAEQVRDRDRS
jgi:hypothetical protein